MESNGQIRGVGCILSKLLGVLKGMERKEAQLLWSQGRKMRGKFGEVKRRKGTMRHGKKEENTTGWGERGKGWGIW